MRTQHVVALNGGLGNQLFQYAFGVWIEASVGQYVRYDSSAFRRNARGLELTEIGIDVSDKLVRLYDWLPYPGGRLGILATLARRIVGPPQLRFEDEHELSVDEVQQPTTWIGYWQRGKYVLPAMSRVRQEIGAINVQTDLIGIHVRRGDMVGRLPETAPESYREMLQELADGSTKHYRIKVFSDDPDWCRRQLDFPGDPEYVSGNSPAEDLLALAQCEKLVLSRSTYSWWAASLVHRPPGHVVAPIPFFPGDPHKDRDLLNPSWLHYKLPEPT